MCNQCKTKPVYEFTNKRKVCSKCFVNYFNKKILYTKRKFNLVDNKDIIGYKDKNDFRSIVLKEILKLISEKNQIRMIKLPSKKRTTKIAEPSTIDSEAYQIIKTLIKGKPENLKKFAPKIKKTIKPLYLFLDEEIMLFAKIKKLKFSKPKIKKTKLQKFIDNLEKKHPEIKRAIINNYLQLNFIKSFNN